jgi:delta(3,5)-delta(2,4)-dienoyl-CoA isomerase
LIKEVDIGIAPDLGTLQRLPRIVGNQSWVNEICLTGRFFNANEALEYGLVSKTFDSKDTLLDECLKLAVLIASKPPLATLSIKHLLTYSRDHSVHNSLKYTSIWNSVMINSPDTLIAASSSLTKKDAIYSKL